jgi:protease IV
MRNFLTSMLGSLAALAVFSVLCLVVLVGILGAIVSIGARKNAAATRIERGSTLVLDLSTNLTDSPPPLDLSAFGREREGPLQLREVTRAVRAAASDGRISGMLITGSLRPEGLGSGYGALRELREAIADFRASHKPVRAYLEFAGNRDYYLASSAGEVVLDPFGVLFVPGLAMQPLFFAGAAEKYGVGVQVTRVGRYKSYVEAFTRREMSPENREESQRLLDDVWSGVLGDIARSRGLAPAAIQAKADSEGLLRADVAKAARLVDKVEYRDQVVAEIRAETGRPAGKESSFRQVSLPAYIRTLSGESRRGARGRLALVYAEGDIVDGEGETGQIGGAAYAREFRRLREDSEVKAVVLRINSPGGSATAAEALAREIRLTRRVKPVIVSMGSYAASGGYWIAAETDRIFADPGTVTGSIGVFGVVFDVQKLLGGLGITTDTVKTGRFADSLTVFRPKTDEEMAVLQRNVDWIYAQFVARVAAGRHLSPSRVEEIAQGRVWSGTEARRLGLVDEIGGLEPALDFARKRAGLEPGCPIVEYPGRKGLAEQIAALLGEFEPEAARAAAGGGILARLRSDLGAMAAAVADFNDPQDAYARLPPNVLLH